MVTQWEISHQELVVYLRGGNGKTLEDKIKRLKAEEPVYEMLFYLVRNCHEVDSLEDLSPPQHFLRFSEIETLLMKLLSAPQAADCRIFLTHLMHSGIFYEQLLEKLSAVAPRIRPEVAWDSAGEPLVMKSDAQLLANIQSLHRTGETTGNENTARRIITSLENVVERLRVWLMGTPLPRYATIAAAAVVALLVIYRIAIPTQPPYAGIWDQQTPYNLAQQGIFIDSALQSATSLRSPSEGRESAYLVLYRVMQSSLNEFQKRNYSDVLKMLEAYPYPDRAENLLSWLESAPAARADTAGVNNARKVIQEYYFYRGLTHLAYSTTARDDLSKSTREQHQESAIRYLTKAHSLARKFALNTGNRETRFLQEAQHFLGE